MNDHSGGPPPGRYWPAPLADSPPPAPPEFVIPERRLSGRAIRFCVIAALVVLAPIVITLVTRGHKDTGPPHTITLPASVGRYERVTGSVADRSVEAMRRAARDDALPEESGAIDITEGAAIGVYHQADDPGRRFVFLGANAATNHNLGELLREHSASRNADDIFETQGGITGARDFEPGPFGGALRCGTGNGGTAVMCVWVDGSTVGMFISAETDVGAFARVALDFRGAAER